MAARHVRRYTSAGLVAQVTRLGLHVECVTSFVSALFPAMAAVRLLAKWRGGSYDSAEEFKIGPLNGLFGRRSGTIEGYSYSPANKNSGIIWDEATFREYIRDPKAKIPGTKMAFPGLKDPKQIDDIVAFLKQFDSTGKKKVGIVPTGIRLARAP